ncbi:MAG: hypothetical protein M5R36_26075 [Deltaproteobacteria bacterium]|nr:hypothetical protein [Deltaproteobacteria bacterium]
MRAVFIFLLVIAGVIIACGTGADPADGGTDGGTDDDTGDDDADDDDTGDDDDGGGCGC